MQVTRPRASAAIAIAAVAATAALGLTGCGADEGSASTVDSTAPAADVELVDGEEVRVSAIDNSFRPEETTVAAGTVVRFTNDGRTGHNVLAVDGETFEVQEGDFQPGDEYTVRLTEPGTYDFYCSLHGTEDKGMVGTITVEG